MDVAKGLAGKLNAVLEEFKKIGTLHVSAGSLGTNAQLMMDDLEGLGLELNVGFRSFDVEYPYEIFAEVDEVKFFALATKAELEEHFPELIKEAEKIEK